ncbi:Eco57I restriction-modification methylase domain-containing protein [Nocardia transvalensis]|uniref:Eco57I restriction-modification methylase domain-containing protein n=1 Tax=Nocardia transvalensis TaxID=37333 RepID=UPI0018950879|nr:N-6 DNA methylase [Nocardia transvalensis]MBF6333487.1 N-6 DNA methylase [Nocardia transvalensis]
MGAGTIGFRAPTRQPVLPRSLIAACERAMREVGGSHQQAAMLVHAAAVVQHAQDVGLVEPGLGVRASLDVLSDRHPALAPLAELPGAPTARAERAIAAVWQRHQIHDTHTLPWAYPLGDLYQSLSTEAVKGRALCQTPWWITDLLIAISYDVAQDEIETPAVIDPACGTGHILVEALARAAAPHRLYDGYSAARPYRHYQPDICSALDRVHGVDIDPWAAAVARYRLIARAWTQLRDHRTASDLADLPVHVAAADALLTNPADEPLLARGRYHVVLANPPYITPKDAIARDAIRARYRDVCHGKYSLALPFHALMHELLLPGGWCAQLTANSFMKREFGQVYIENWLTRCDLRWVIDTSGAYIPGHGTPTVILCTRNAPPANDTVHTVRGVHGEPTRPEEPSQGKVWRAIEDAVHRRLAYDRLARGAEAAWRLDHPGAAPAADIAVDPEPLPAAVEDCASEQAA